MFKNIQKYLPHIMAIGLFMLISIIYFNPVLQGKILNQSDLVQAKGMEHEREVYKEKTGKEVYWTNSAFGGMPTYLLGSSFPYNYTLKFQKALSFLPRPANFLFLYFLSFYILMLVLKLDWKLAVLGSLAFGFSTYYIIIIGVGHLAKVRAIAYFPLVLAGILMVFERKKYLWGFLLTTLALSLEINSGHYQMTYYLLFSVLFLGFFFLLDAYKEKKIHLFIKELGILVLAAILALGMNLSHILPAREYVQESIRGKQILTISPDGSPKPVKEGLTKSYITEYSYGLAETFNLLIPRFMGGSNMENLGKDSNLYKELLTKTDRRTANEFIKNVSTYWGDQPIVAAPAYIGAAVIFLAVLGLFFYKGKHKKWIVASILLALLLSWGKNFSLLTDLFIDYVPLYNKFRTVASIQVIIEFLVPVLAVLGLYAFIKSEEDTEQKKKKLLKITGAFSVLLLLFILFGASFFTFESPQDGMYAQYGLLNALIEDRKALLVHDSIRSLLFILAVAASLYLYLQNKLSYKLLVPVLLIIVLFDLAGVDKNYVNEKNFVDADYLDRLFTPSPIDKEILKDTSYYRVMNFTRNPLTDGITSYHHKQLGGYHAAKPRRTQDLFDFYLSSKLNPEVLNMYNIKYLVVPTEKQTSLQINDQANGNAWFVSQIKWVNSENEEIKALENINTRQTAVLNEKYKKQVGNIGKDSLSFIKLNSYHPEKMVYVAENSQDGLAVFSENWYPYGWKATIDGKGVPILKADYSLRALYIPKGKHEIVFQFDPEIVKKASRFSLISYIIFIVLFLSAIIYKKMKK
jgi:hypothetical protein